MKTTWKECISAFAEMCFPTDIYCICCGSIIDATRTYSLCDNCIDKFTWVSAEDALCEKCGKIIGDAENARATLCFDCREREHLFRKGYTTAQYNLYERAAIMDFKYRDKVWIGKKLGQAMADRIACESVSYDMVLPVPIHEQRRNERGYNQAAVLAECVAKRLSAPCRTDVLFRKKKTPAMKDLGTVERIQNMKDAFAVRKKEAVSGREILVIDDIYTTGATLDACAKALTESGAKAVDILTFAAGGNYRPGTEEG